MARITPCLPFGMEKALRELEREGWRIHSARGDTGYALASYYGTGIVYKWDVVEGELKAVNAMDYNILMKNDVAS